MEKGVPSSLFVNDGSFMERFKQLQQQKDVKDKAAALEESIPPKFVKGAPPATDPITMMEFYMKKAAEEEKMRLPKGDLDLMLFLQICNDLVLGLLLPTKEIPFVMRCAHHPGEVTPYDDINEQYKKRMMLGYRYGPNPLNNPRKSYYYCMEPLGGSRRLCFNRKKVYAQLGSCFFFF
ncbi:hypothetical protein Goshw_022851 [Gossypium schwendimanii]|uniref:SURP motif domain-containing protein n=1 Tax=Gossypium schwendimanii TaxID=34291 RepID=A0A7J9L579_GOSSC|nr:hypothetical protein [Gossypium schwendimanii]